MKHTVVLNMFALLLVTSVLFHAPLSARAQEVSSALPTTQGGKYVPGTLLIKYKDGSVTSRKGVQSAKHLEKRAAREARLAKHSATITHSIPKIGVEVLKVPKGKEKAVFAELSKDPEVEYVEYDYPAHPQVVPNDPFYSTKQWQYSVISAPAGWNIATSASSIVVAIADDGVHPNHPDLKANLLPAYSVVTESPTTELPLCTHGTLVAGVVGQVGNNALGGAGMAWNVKMLPVNLSSNESTTTCSTSSINELAEALVYATDQGVDIINMSWGGGSLSTLETAVNYATSRGVLVVSSGGNENASNLLYPAAYERVVGVGATQKAATTTAPSGDTRARYSNYGPALDVMAPGSAIYTTSGTTYANKNGTSLASPMVAGLAALVLSVNPDLSYRQVREVILQNTDDLGTPGWDQYYGWGRINVQKTLTAAQSLVPEVDTTAPTITVTAPSDGAILYNEVSVSVENVATDDFGVTRKELYVDGLLYAESLGPKQSFWWSGDIPVGQHTLQVKAYDLAGNVAESPVITVQVMPADDDDPVMTNTTESTYPATTGSVTLSVTTSEPAVCRYSLDEWDSYTSMSDFATTGQTTHTSAVGVTGGDYTYYVLCRDAAGNRADEAMPIPFTVAGGVPGLALAYSFDSLTVVGSEVTDVSGKGTSGTLVHNPTSVAGRQGEALSFNGASYVDLGTSSFGLANNHTFSFWMKQNVNNSLVANDGILGRGGSTHPLTIQIANNQKMRVATRLTNGTTTAVSSALTSDVLALGIWTHVAVVHDGDAGVRKIYFNGVLKSQTVIAGTQDWSNSTRKLTLGRVSLTASDGFMGAIDDFQLYDRALTDSEVQQIAQ